MVIPLSSRSSASDSERADLSLDNLEFSALPSGLHLVEQDVVCVSCFTPASLRRWVCPTTYHTAWTRSLCVFADCSAATSIKTASTACASSAGGKRPSRATGVSASRLSASSWRNPHVRGHGGTPRRSRSSRPSSTPDSRAPRRLFLWTATGSPRARSSTSARRCEPASVAQVTGTGGAMSLCVAFLPARFR